MALYPKHTEMIMGNVITSCVAILIERYQNKDCNETFSILQELLSTALSICIQVNLINCFCVTLIHGYLKTFVIANLVTLGTISYTFNDHLCTICLAGKRHR